MDEICSEKRNSLGNTRLSRPTITRRIGDLSQDIEDALEMKINQICELQNKKICDFTALLWMKALI